MQLRCFQSTGENLRRRISIGSTSVSVEEDLHRGREGADDERSEWPFTAHLSDCFELRSMCESQFASGLNRFPNQSDFRHFGSIDNVYDGHSEGHQRLRRPGEILGMGEPFATMFWCPRWSILKTSSCQYRVRYLWIKMLCGKVPLLSEQAL